ncbi:MAG: hypothetical protein Q7S36_01970 [Candidatus Liptonbacteria bacterium]|nr:hypothetical protein [Candidatus Liptonbacteria bacterium]
MDGEQKKFGLAEIIILLLFAVTNDILTLVVDFVFLIPIIGQVIGVTMEGINVAIWAIVLFWFIAKAGFKGGSGMLQVAGGVAQFFGIPARTAVVAFGIYFVNHPKVGAVAGLALGKTAAFQEGSKTIASANRAALQKMPASMRGKVTESEEKERLASEEKDASGKTEVSETAFGMPEEDAIKEREEALFENVVTEELPKREAEKSPEQKREEGKTGAGSRYVGQEGGKEKAESGQAKGGEVGDRGEGGSYAYADIEAEKTAKGLSRGVEMTDIEKRTSSEEKGVPKPSATETGGAGPQKRDTGGTSSQEGGGRTIGAGSRYAGQERGKENAGGAEETAEGGQAKGGEGGSYAYADIEAEKTAKGLSRGVEMSDIEKRTSSEEKGVPKPSATETGGAGPQKRDTGGTSSQAGGGKTVNVLSGHERQEEAKKQENPPTEKTAPEEAPIAEGLPDTSSVKPDSVEASGNVVNLKKNQAEKPPEPPKPKKPEDWI